MTDKNEPKGINLMRDLGYDESDPEVIEARAEAKAEAEAAAKSEAAGEATAEGGGYGISLKEFAIVAIFAVVFAVGAIVLALVLWAQPTPQSEACNQIAGSTWNANHRLCVGGDGVQIADPQKYLSAHPKGE